MLPNSRRLNASTRLVTLYRCLATLLIMSLLVSACKLSPKPEPTPTATALAPTATFTPEIRDSGLPISDPGSPLPPQIVERSPAPGEELPASSPLQITFDQAMDIDRTNAALQVKAEDGTAVAGQVTWPTPRTLRFVPAQPWQSGGRYWVSLNTQALSAQGVGLVEPVDFRFQTMGPLQVSQVFPPDGSSGVASDAAITVIFNRPVVPLLIAEEQANLPTPIQIEPAVAGEGQWVSTSVYAFRPTTGLASATTYRVTVKAGLADAVQESRLESDYSWGFTTSAPGIASFGTMSGIVNPGDDFTDILLDEAFFIAFMQPMDQSSTLAALSLTQSNGEPAALITRWSEDSTQLVITPTVRLALGATYTLQLAAGARSADGGTLLDGLRWTFHTVPPPAILYTRPENGEVKSEHSPDFYIKFASPMRLDTVKERIVITPAPERPPEWWYNEWDWSLVAFFLQPSTRYEIRLLPGMQDIYGNAISTEKVIRFTTGPVSPSASLLMPYDAILLRADAPETQRFYVSWQNVSRVSLELHRLTPQQFTDFITGRSSSYSYNPSAATLVWRADQVSRGALNERVVQDFRPTLSDGSPLTPGFYYLGLDSPEPYHQERFVDFRLIMVSNVNLAFKSTANAALVWATDLESGTPVPNLPLMIYDENLKPIGNGITDQNGLATLLTPSPASPYENRFVMTGEGTHFGFVSSAWGSGVSLWDYGIWGNYYAPPNQPTAYIYTERPIYRPGQPVYYKGIVRLDDDLLYRLPDASKVHVTISNYKEVVFDEDLPLSSFGSFASSFRLDPEATLGYYTIAVSLPNSEEVIGSVNFTVAEYRKPEFQVRVTASEEDVLSGQSVTFQIQADYYSGGAVSNARVSWTLTSDRFSFTPPDEYSGYNFSDYEEEVYSSEEFSEEGNEVIARGEGQTDSQGRLSVRLPIDLSKYKNSRQLTFEATVTDIAQNAVSGRAVVVAHRSAVYPGIRPQSYVGKAGEEQQFEMVALDWNGNPLAGQALSVTIVERRWSSVQEQDPSGQVKWKTTVQEIPVASFTDLVTDSQGKAIARYTPPNGGIFRARVIAKDAQGNEGRASAYQWIASDEFVPWMQTNDRSFELVTDRKSYNPGDTALILIASPFQGSAYALVTVERGKVRFHDVLRLESNSTMYALPITADMAPNVYVSVLVVKGVDATNPYPDFKMGIAEIKITTSVQALKVELQSDRQQVGPGEAVSFTVRTRDFQGKPVSAEVSLSLSDLATLSLLPPNQMPLLDYFYAHRVLGVWTSMPLVLTLDEYNAKIAEKLAAAPGYGMGSGGAKGFGELGVIEVRQDFPDTAYWEAFLVTDARGEATVTITLPDNLTTWRLDARAITQNTSVGQATLDIVSSKPLLVRPTTPRFFVAGDQVRLGAAVQNNTAQDLTATVTLASEGLTLQDPASQQVQVPARGQVYLTWNATVNSDASRVDLIFSAEGGGYRDATRPPVGTLENQGLPVYRYEAPETVGTSGQLTAEGVNVEAISLPGAWQTGSGNLTIRLSPSLAASMTDGLSYLEHYPYECIEQTISRFLPNVIITRALKSAGLSDAENEARLQERVVSTLQRLYNWQNPDGGWGWWSDSESDPLTSAYVVLGLIEAQAAGYSVNSEVLENGLSYLRGQIIDIPRLTEPTIMNRQAFILYVLARAGKPAVSSTVQLYEQRQRLALYAQAFLLHALQRIDAGDPRLKTMLADFNSAAIVSASGTHWEEAEFDPWNWNTDTRTTAIILSVLSQIDPLNPLNANAVRWLMSHRSGGTWRTTQETAWTLMGLTNWMVASGELNANYQYAVALNGKRLGGGVADRETLRRTLELKVDISELMKDQLNRLAIGRDGGPGNLYYTAHLNVMLPVEQIQPLNRGIIVSRSYYRLDDPQTPVMQAKLGELLLVRLTVVAPNSLHFALVDDPLPAGLEAVDQTLLTSPQSVEVPSQYSLNDLFFKGWGWWIFRHIQLRDERVILSADYLPAGTYVYTYLVRASTVGVFQAMPPTAQEFYFPEVYGRGAGSLFTVVP